VVPLTFCEASHWYQNIRAAGGCVITYRALGLLVSGSDWRDRSYGLTDIGQATALEAL
jgi:hypothetical protein